jgi:hypothetical protein
MKRAKFVIVVSMVVALLVASASQITAGQSKHSRPDGILRMKHSPVLGINIPIAVWIDGVQAGVFAKGHVYQRSLAPGRHDLYASRPGQLSNSFHGKLDVRPGETYSFVVKATPNQIYLIPVSRID